MSPAARYFFFFKLFKFEFFKKIQNSSERHGISRMSNIFAEKCRRLVKSVHTLADISTQFDWVSSKSVLWVGIWAVRDESEQLECFVIYSEIYCGIFGESVAIWHAAGGLLLIFWMKIYANELHSK